MTVFFNVTDDNLAKAETWHTLFDKVEAVLIAEGATVHDVIACAQMMLAAALIREAKANGLSRKKVVRSFCADDTKKILQMVEDNWDNVAPTEH
jgi:hypothetical protein